MNRLFFTQINLFDASGAPLRDPHWTGETVHQLEGCSPDKPGKPNASLAMASPHTLVRRLNNQDAQVEQAGYTNEDRYSDIELGDEGWVNPDWVKTVTTSVLPNLRAGKLFGGASFLRLVESNVAAAKAVVAACPGKKVIIPFYHGQSNPNAHLAMVKRRVAIIDGRGIPWAAMFCRTFNGAAGALEGKPVPPRDFVGGIEQVLPYCQEIGIWGGVWNPTGEVEARTLLTVLYP